MDHKEQPQESFEADVRRLVANGANLDSSHALILAVMNGATSEAQLGLLVSLVGCQLGAPISSTGFSKWNLLSSSVMLTREPGMLVANDAG